MVTSWPNHWDRIRNKAAFTYSMLRGGVMNPEKIVDHTPTIFIKIDKETKLPKKCWEGKIYGKNRTDDKVWFEFSLFRQIECPKKYIGYPEGWYADETPI